ncbi:hypothetical protein DASC09_021440 [Saccharomycopsis crataegensis]|uniref:Uncharacterized protein n=1 Tax=Saccharomycopsis crataegensis TaxID=43959 RepID=A0AAV5QJM9_9ASCO|nr:hypothetical protein DASC09_021440 [Saccharomycopsis crataegensis]
MNCQLPPEDILKNPQLTAILHSNLAKEIHKYSAVVYTTTGQLLYGWGISVENSSGITNITVENAEILVKGSLKVLNANHHLMASIDNEENDDLRMVRTSYGKGKEIIIIPGDELVISVFVSRI